MTKHSPGPWKWEQQDEVYLVASDGTKIISASGVDGNEADDNLITAAPNLLKALKALCKIAEYGDVASWAIEWDAASAAINEAERETE